MSTQAEIVTGQLPEPGEPTTPAIPSSPGQPRVQVVHTHDGVFTAIKALLEVVVLATFIVTFVVQPFRIPSESMVPTLLVGDFLLVDKQSYGPGGPLDHLLPPENVHRGDLIVFHFPVDPDVHVVKRVVGMPGDHLKLRDGQVYINGSPLQEPYAYYMPSVPDHFRDDFPSLRTADPNADPRWWAQLRRILLHGEITVPNGSYFVLGDNRNNSEDSRYWGFVPQTNIVGKPLVVYFTTSLPEAAFAAVTTPVQRLKMILHQVRILR